MPSTETSVDLPAIRAELGRHQLTQGQAAEALSLSRTGFYRRMSGDVEFTATELTKLAALFHVELSSLLRPVVPAIQPALAEGGDAA